MVKNAKDAKQNQNWSLRKGMVPFQAREAGKIHIRRHRFAAMLHRERRQVGIRNQVAHCLAPGEHLLQDYPVPARRSDNARAWLIQPALDTGDGLLE